MAFHNVSLPEGLQYGSLSGPGFSTIVQQTASGHEVRIARQSQGRHRFQLVKALQTTAEAQALKAFALARRGSLHSWRLRDELDYTSAADGQSAPTRTDQILGTGDGTTREFQLVKTYDATGPSPYVRTITLPVAGSIVADVAGTERTDFSQANGVIRFVTAPADGEIVSAGFRFEVPVRFERGVDEWMRLQADAFAIWSVPDLAAIEVLDEVEWPELWYPGGSYDHGERTTDFSIEFRAGQFQSVTSNGAGTINAYLPAADYLPGGDCLLVFQNKAASTQSVQLRDANGATVGSAITAGSIKRLALSVSGSTASWVIY